MYGFTLDIINHIIANLKIKLLKIKMWKVLHFIVIYVPNTSGRLDILNRLLVTFLYNPGWFFLLKTFKIRYHKRGAMFRLTIFKLHPLSSSFSSSFSKSLQYLGTIHISLSSMAYKFKSTFQRRNLNPVLMYYSISNIFYKNTLTLIIFLTEPVSNLHYQWT